MNGQLALMHAVHGCDLAGVERLLENNPDINVDIVYHVRGDEEIIDTYTALGVAIIENDIAIVEVLLAHGASVNGRDGVHRTPLQLACQSGNSGIVSFLLDHGANVEGTTARERKTPLTLACTSDTNLGIAQLLLNAGAHVNGGNSVLSPLHAAAHSGSTAAIDLLIDAGADVNIPPMPGGSTPLHFASFEAKFDCVTRLLAAGAVANIPDSAGQTPLHRATLRSPVEIVNALLDAGCDPLHRDNNGRTPLQYASNTQAHLPFIHASPDVFTALVAAGDRSWECVPTPCPGLEAAIVSVWQASPQELPELVKRLENPPQTLIELYARMDDEEMKKAVQEVLRVLHHHFSGFPEVKEHLLKSIFGLTTSV